MSTDSEDESTEGNIQVDFADYSRELSSDEREAIRRYKTYQIKHLPDVRSIEGLINTEI